MTLRNLSVHSLQLEECQARSRRHPERGFQKAFGVRVNGEPVALWLAHDDKFALYDTEGRVLTILNDEPCFGFVPEDEAHDFILTIHEERLVKVTGNMIAKGVFEASL